MEFSVKKFDLQEELELTQGVVERKTTIPILSNILVEATGGRLTITATDLEDSRQAGQHPHVLRRQGEDRRFRDHPRKETTGTHGPGCYGCGIAKLAPLVRKKQKA